MTKENMTNTKRRIRWPTTFRGTMAIGIKDMMVGMAMVGTNEEIWGLDPGMLGVEVGVGKEDMDMGRVAAAVVAEHEVLDMGVDVIVVVDMAEVLGEIGIVIGIEIEVGVGVAMVVDDLFDEESVGEVIKELVTNMVEEGE